MTERFLKYFPLLIEFEGTEFEDDPADRGGATRFGIDQRSHPEVNIRNLTLEDAKRIYWQDYWTPVKADELPVGVGEVVFDIAVNNGRGRAIKWLQAAVGAVVDGVIGPKTVSFANSMPFGTGKEAGLRLADLLLNRREDFYRSIAKGSQAKFLRGWLNRNDKLRAYVSKLWANQSPINPSRSIRSE